jgi:hypothetical protein
VNMACEALAYLVQTGGVSMYEADDDSEQTLHLVWLSTCDAWAIHPGKASALTPVRRSFPQAPGLHRCLCAHKIWAAFTPVRRQLSILPRRPESHHGGPTGDHLFTRAVSIATLLGSAVHPFGGCASTSRTDRSPADAFQSADGGDRSGHD